MFKDLVGDIPESRILDFLLLRPHTGHTLAKIIEATDLNFRTAQKKIQNLVDLGVVSISHEDKKSKFYIINTEQILHEIKRMTELWGKY
jgi:predicted transcriptional regulator